MFKDIKAREQSIDVWNNKLSEVCIILGLKSYYDRSDIETSKDLIFDNYHFELTQLGVEGPMYMNHFCEEFSHWLDSKITAEAIWEEEWD